jgi:hypothetical protein
MQTKFLATPGRWIGLILTYGLFCLGWAVVYLVERKAPDKNTIMAVGLISQNLIMLVALVALWRPRFLPPRQTPAEEEGVSKSSNAAAGGSWPLKGTGMLLALIMGGLTVTANGQTNPPIKILSGTASDQENPDLSVPWCIAGGLVAGAVVIGFGIGASYIMWRMCHLTNNSLAGGSAPFAGGPRKPVSTNTVATNMPMPTPSPENSRQVTVATVATSFAGFPTAYNPDITASNYLDLMAPPGTVFTIWMADTNLQASGDLRIWTNYSVNTWVSAHGVLSVVYEGANKIPIVTNYVTGDPFGGQQATLITVPLPRLSGSKKFFTYSPLTNLTMIESPGVRLPSSPGTSNKVPVKPVPPPQVPAATESDAVAADPATATVAASTTKLLVAPVGQSSARIPLAIFPPGFNFTGYVIYDPATGESISGSGYIKK